MTEPPTVKASGQTAPGASLKIVHPLTEMTVMFFRNYPAIAGLALLIAILAFTFVGPYIHTTDPFEMVWAPFTPPGEEGFLFGTDYLGRDILAAMMVSGQVSMAIGLAAAVISVVIGVSVGAFAGYYGGLVEEALMRFTEFFQVLPTLLFSMVIVALFGASLMTFTVGEQIAESVRLHEGASRQAAMSRAVEMLRAVEIPEPEMRANAYPHQLSGGMRQRVMIAIALACRPRVLIADEPTTALDATVQAQIFDLLQTLQDETGTAIVLITHDMGAIAELADSVAVMYAGRVVETGAVEEVLSSPTHPYTRGLIECVPHLELNPPAERTALLEIPGVVPALTELGQGCAFALRCALAMEQCEEARPMLVETRPGHQAACWVTGLGREPQNVSEPAV